MELRNFLYLVYKQKFMMLATAIIAMAITFQSTKKMPESYISKARLATGLVDQTEAAVFETKQDMGESKINLQFANLIQSIQLKKIIDQVSYQLILHDLTNKVGFRKKSKLLSSLNKNAVAHAITVFTYKYQMREALSLYDSDQKGLEDVLASMEYDFESLKKKVIITRIANTDFVDMTCEGDNPQFCAFVLNTLCNEFITYYNLIVKESHIKGVNFLDNLLREKRQLMNEKMDTLKVYKIRNRVLNLNEQAKSIYAQIADYEQRKELALKDEVSLAGAIKGIDNKFDPHDRMYIESTLIKINQEIMATKDILKRYSETYIKSNYDPRVKVKIDSMQTVLTAQITQLSDKYIVNPLAAKESLVSQKLNLEVQLDISKNGISTLQNKIDELNREYDRLVPHEAVIQRYETEIDIASKEYIEILQKYNQSSMESSIMPRLKQIELAMPGPPAPSKKTILIVVSGIVPIVLYIIVIFVLFLMDDTLKTSKELADKTNIPVLGYLPLLDKTHLNLQSIWKSNTTTNQLKNYKDLLRSSRFEIEQELKDKKVLAITSISANEGKSFIALSVAYAFAMAQKKVLLIDGNFENPSVTHITKGSNYVEDYFKGLIAPKELLVTEGFSLLVNRGGDNSLFELTSEEVIKEKLEQLKEVFDLIIFDISSLDNLNKSKEWIVVSDKVLSVFAANHNITVMKDLQINYLRGLNDQYIGWMLNKVVGHKSRLKNGLIFLNKWLKKTKKK